MSAISTRRDQLVFRKPPPDNDDEYLNFQPKDLIITSAEGRRTFLPAWTVLNPRDCYSEEKSTDVFMPLHFPITLLAFHHPSRRIPWKF